MFAARCRSGLGADVAVCEVRSRARRSRILALVAVGGALALMGGERRGAFSAAPSGCRLTTLTRAVARSALDLLGCAPLTADTASGA